MMGLLKAGMICARLNFSHGDHEGHQKVVDTFRQVVKDSGRQCALMLDTKVRCCFEAHNKQLVLLKSFWR